MTMTIDLAVIFTLFFDLCIPLHHGRRTVALHKGAARIYIDR